MADLNPYAPPKSESETFRSSTAEIYRRGSELVVPRSCRLPPRCVRCNQPMSGQYLTRKLYWHPPALYLLALLNLVIYAIVALLVRKVATIEVGLCAAHGSQRRRDIWIIIALMVGGPLVSIAGLWAQNSIVAATFPFACVAAGIFAVVRTNIVKPKRIYNDLAILKGASPAFLDSLPR